MSFEILILLFVLTFLIIALYFEKFHPAATFTIAVAILVVTGILSPKDALLGFSNPSIAIIILLLVISNIIHKIGVINIYFSKILKENISYKSFLSKMFLTTSALSSFLNNTPIVAMLIPYVYQWSKKNNISPSKLLIPLSYAAILGGTITLIGTSTNLIVNGLAVESGLKSLHILDFAWVGIPTTVIGFLYIYFVGHKLLPNRKDILDTFLENKKEYLVETVIKEDSKIVGKTVKDAKLRNLKGLFLVEIIRDQNKISPVSPDEVLEKNDILIFAGQVDSITELISSDIGLSIPDICIVNGEKTDIVEVVISNNSYLINKKVKDTDFRAKYDAAILAVHRNGEKLSGKIGDIILKAGDVLLIVAGKDFWKRTEDTTDFYPVSKVKEIFNIDIKKANLILLGFISIILLSIFHFINLFSGLLLFISALIFFRITTYSEVRKGLDLNLIIIAALSLAIGKAMIITNLSDIISKGIISAFSVFGIVGALIGVYLLANILTEFITNIAAASITFPVALSLAKHLSIDPTAFILAVAFGASASFITPIGYQTNIMVYAVGNYKFKDFLIVGLPLSILYSIICISILYLVFIRGI
ncbi:SLC13 family permease [Hydrogenothermus marinus]|uniref:Di/tricarboxylate transporter n=1 Tax=Hydrogenothermus marinus TaxID=133270 RepID=A0A3M0B7C8_9AQUI|nr:SLC13 family permease [Hydrogenothermus marinus]RMA93320.1 di/tricarboxylate transporter [Hydrogenothermus marinus]